MPPSTERKKEGVCDAVLFCSALEGVLRAVIWGLGRAAIVSVYSYLCLLGDERGIEWRRTSFLKQGGGFLVSGARRKFASPVFGHP